MTTARQVAVIAVRGSSRRLEVCLIRRKGSKKWRIPKGFIDPGDSPEQAALTEAVEEAGLKGRIIGSRVGIYEYDKWGARLTVAVYLMNVVKEQEEWPEMHLRTRRWYSLKKAGVLLADHPVAPLWEHVKGRLRSRRGGATKA
jgi:8-oxo-dGTP pyrophosphatase MutT (NUDIX family)